MGDIISDLREIAKWLRVWAPTHEQASLTVLDKQQALTCERAADELQHWRSAAEAGGCSGDRDVALGKRRLTVGDTTTYDRCKAEHPELMAMAEELLSVEMERDALKAEVERLKADRAKAQREAFAEGASWAWDHPVTIGGIEMEQAEELDRRYPEPRHD